MSIRCWVAPAQQGATRPKEERAERLPQQEVGAVSGQADAAPPPAQAPDGLCPQRLDESCQKREGRHEPDLKLRGPSASRKVARGEPPVRVTHCTPKMPWSMSRCKASCVVIVLNAGRKARRERAARWEGAAEG